MTIPQLLHQAVQHHQAGHFQPAESLYRKILQKDPRNSDAHHLLGLIAHHFQNYPVAIQLIQQAISLNSKIPDFHSNLGLVFADSGQLDQATQCFQHALTLSPQDANLYHHLGNVLYKQRQFDQAVSYYQKAISLNPHDAKFHNNLGNVFSTLERFDEAVASFQRAVTLQPDFAEAYNNLGATFQEMGKIDQALACFQRAVQLKPDFAGAYNNLGAAFNAKSQFAQATACLQRALAIHPQFDEAYDNLGNVFKKQGTFPQAMACYQRAIALNPNQANAYNNLGTVFNEQGQLTSAISHFQRAILLSPHSPLYHNNLGAALNGQGNLDQALSSFQTALELKPSYSTAHSNLLFALNYSDHHDSTTIFAEHQKFDEQQVKPFTSSIKLPLVDASNSHRRLRIGYISQDFRKHSVAYFIEPILAHHDRQQFDIFCYFNNANAPDAVTQRLQQHATGWLNCFDWSDDDLAEKIRQDRIDILVDLMGHTGSNRIMVFARKPAPIQVTYLGYSNTTGLGTIDYRITDNYADPEGIAEQFNSEKLVRLPGSYFCYRPADDTDQAPVNPLPALHNGYITLGSFNNHAKLSSTLLHLWARLLQKLPEAKLLVKNKSLNDPATQQSLQSYFTQFGISPDRLLLKNYAITMMDHLNQYSQVDIALDSFPYNGATTTCESLWMGVPVVTLVGERHVSRMGLSILSTVGLTELIAHSPEEYLNICVTLAQETDRLQQLRATLRQRLQSSPLMDAPAFTRRLEEVYRGLWRAPGALTPGPSPRGRGEEAPTPGPSPRGRGEEAPTPGPSPRGRGEEIPHPAILPSSYGEKAGNESLLPSPSGGGAGGWGRIAGGEGCEVKTRVSQAWQLFQTGQPAKAETLCRQVLQNDPHQSSALHLLGLIAYQTQRQEEAIELLKQAISLNPAEPYIHSNLGNMLAVRGKIAETVECFQRAIAINSKDELAHNNLGKQLCEQGHIDEALAQFKTALKLKPNYAIAHSNLVFALNYSDHHDAATIFAEHRKFEEQQAKPLTIFIQPHVIDQNPQRRLRIGYLSQDFRKHSVAYFIEPILAHHDRQQFEVLCYFNNFANPDEVTQRLQHYVDGWLNCFRLSDAELAERIRQDRIDILVDLMGHTGFNRIMVLARKPAPVQMTYLGYSNTTGLTSIDYHITDNYADPEGIAEQFNSEQLVRLPGSYFCYRPADDTDQATVDPLPALHNGYITFGSFNNRAKLSPTTLNLWAQVLLAIPHSKLLVKTKSLDDPATRQALQDQFASLGITSERLMLLGYATSMTDHLKSYGQVDIALDSFPYNGATTTCEALWMGVPVVTLVGERHVSRMGLSILSAVGLTEGIAYSPEEYIRICLQLANNISSLQTLRETLRGRVRSSVLMDAVTFTRQLEEVYRRVVGAKFPAEASSPPAEASSPPAEASSPENSPAEASSPERSKVWNVQEAKQFYETGKFSEAEAICQAILQQQPNDSLALHILGLIASHANNDSVAEELLRKVIVVHPQEPHVYTNLGIILQKQGRLVEAIACWQQALSLDPKDTVALHNLGKERCSQGQIREALAHFRRALEWQPQFPAITHSNLLLTLNYADFLDAQTIFAEHQQFEEQQAKPLAVFQRPHGNDRNLQRRLRIGYLSQDFRKHSVAYFIEPILACHDSQQFEIFCYFNNVNAPDTVTQRLQQHATGWLNCFDWSDDDLAEKIREDQIDILVDLMGHTGHNRILVFARKPAPVQVAYLGYSNTTGLTSIDYRLTDHYADPQGVADQLSSETLVRLPGSYFCYRPADDTGEMPVEAPPVFRNDYITFGSFNNQAKLSPTVLSLWAKILHTVPNAKLLIKTRSLDIPTARQSLQDQLVQFGIHPDRLILLGYATDMTEHLQTYHQVDIALDSFPYHGATTTCEALWMGVPVVTLVGERHVSRMGLSILSSLGLTELVAYTPEGYVKLCVKLANNPSYLQRLRTMLRYRMQASPLMDAVSFTQRLEAVYRQLWEKWCENGG